MLAPTGSYPYRAPFGLPGAAPTPTYAAQRPRPIAERPALFVGPYRG